MDLFSFSPLDSLPNNASQAGLPEGRPIYLEQRTRVVFTENRPHR